MKATITLLPGDGIGPEVTAAAVRVLEAVAEARGHSWTFQSHAIGGAALAQGQPPLPDATLAAARKADAVFLGAVGDPRFDGEPPARRPEAALLALRRELDVFANIRPLRAWPGLDEVSPLKARVLKGTDLVIVRELTSGLYYGQPRGRADDQASAINTMRYTRAEVERVARVAFALADKRRRHVTSVDKANVLEVSRLWREVVTEVARDFPGVTLTHEYVDTAAMKLALTPSAFDVMLTENMFGDILSDEAGGIAGSLGVLPSASLGRGAGLFEPVHGSAPTIAGRDIANPIGAIASAAMLLGDGLGLSDDAALIVAAIEQVLTAGIRTVDIAAPGARAVGTRAFADAVAGAVSTIAQRGKGAPIVV
jgi:3-isopropylmalate dehydrogenase